MSPQERLGKTVSRLSRPGSVFLYWCFYAPRRELPLSSFSGRSRLAPPIEPGEEEELFGDLFSMKLGMLDAEVVIAHLGLRERWFRSANFIVV